MGRKRPRVDSGNISRKHQKTAGHGLADGQSRRLDGAPSSNNNTNKPPDRNRKRANSIDREREADFGKTEEKRRRRERLAKVQHEDSEIDKESRRPLRPKHGSKNLQESSDEETLQANKRLDGRDPDFDPKGRAAKGQDTVPVKALKLKQSLDNREQLENAAETLRCTDQHMNKWHQDLRLPNKVDFNLVEIGAGSTGDSDKKWQASTVDEKYLEGFGWDFSTGGDKCWNNPLPAEELYKNPIPLEGGNIPWDARPFVLVEGSNKIAERSDRLIKNGWKGAVMRLTSDRPSLFPQEWKASEKLNGPRPELPPAYKDALNKGPPEVGSTKEKKRMRRSASQRSNMADTPQKPTTDLPPQSTISGAVLPVMDQATNPTSPVTSTEHVGLLLFSSSDLQPIQEEREASPNLLVNNQHTKVPGEGGTENMVDSLISRWNLSPVYKHAVFLAKLIEADQLKFDRHESKRKLCDLLCSLEESHNRQHGPLPFKFVPMVDIEKLDREQHRGNVALTEDALHVGDSAMETARRWIEFQGISGQESVNPAKQALLDDILQQIRKKERTIQSPAELAIERKSGALFVGLFRFDDLIEVTNNYLQAPRYLRQAGIRPYPDFAVRPSADSWSFWPAAMTPTVASYDAKRSTELENHTAAAQLALNMLPTLIVSVCMYLDTRKEATDPLPGWLFFYSWLYTEAGFIVYIHYPSAELTEDATDWSWKFHSLLLTEKFAKVWAAQASNPYIRMSGHSAMVQIRSHTRTVLDQIRAWAKNRAQYGGGGILDQLIARTHYEQGNKKWLIDQAAKVTGRAEAGGHVDGP